MPIGAFFGGVGKAAADIADKHIAANLAEERSRYEELRDRRAAEYREQIRRSGGEHDYQQGLLRSKLEEADPYSKPGAERNKRVSEVDARNDAKAIESLRNGAESVDLSDGSYIVRGPEGLFSVSKDGEATRSFSDMDEFEKSRFNVKEKMADRAASVKEGLLEVQQQKADANDRRMEIMAAGIAKSARGANDKDPAVIQTARIIQEDVKKRTGKDISLVEANEMIHKSGGDPDALALRMAKLIQELGPEEAQQTLDQARKMTGKGGGPKIGGGARLDGLPQGSKKIGTSGGKDVYQTPDGKKFIQE